MTFLSGVLLIGIVAAIALISISASIGKRKAERKKPLRNIGSLLMGFLLRLISMVLVFVFLVFTGPPIKISLRDLIPIGIFFAGVLVFFCVIPEQWAHRRYKKKFEKNKQKLERGGLRFPGIWLK